MYVPYLAYSVPHRLAFTVSCMFRGYLALPSPRAHTHTHTVLFSHSLVHTVVHKRRAQRYAQSQHPHFPFAPTFSHTPAGTGLFYLHLIRKFPYRHGPCHTLTCQYCMHLLQNPSGFATCSHLPSAPSHTVSLFLSLGCIHMLFTVTYFLSNQHYLNSGL